MQQLLVSPSKDKKLNRKHVMRITRAAWEEAFSVRVCQHAWQKIGIYPYFDQCPYWEQKAKEVAAAALKAKAAQVTQDRQQLADAALRIDPADLVIITDESESDDGDAPGERKKRRNNSSQFALQVRGRKDATTAHSLLCWAQLPMAKPLRSADRWKLSDKHMNLHKNSSAKRESRRKPKPSKECAKQGGWWTISWQTTASNGK